MRKRTRRKGTNGDPAGARGRARLVRAAALALAAVTVALAVPCLAAEGAADGRAAAGIAEARAVIQTALSRYEAARTYRLDFVQETYWALADSTATVAGSLLYRRPGSIALSYEDGSRIVVTGDTMRVYVAQTAQFFVVEVDSADVAVDPPRLLRAYRPDAASPFAERDPLPGGLRVVTLRPGARQDEPARVEVTIDPGSGSVASITAYSSSGDRTTYAIRGARFDVPAPDGDFVLRRPPGATLVKGSPF